jgi:hypothetical protein
MNHNIAKIISATEHLRQEIIHHKVYRVIDDIEDLKLFMKYHIYAVWDFMSLLKSLQNNLTCTTVPWFPKGDAETRFLINEIVAGEESDLAMDGSRKSHFELYLDAMQQCGADATSILTFINSLQTQHDFQTAYAKAQTPKAAQEFVNFTFDVVHSNKSYLQSAIFTFGREDLIPGMFMSMIDDMYSRLPESISIFKYYLERHIEVDGDHHSHLSLQMTAHLCGDDEQKWKEAEQVTIKSLQSRIALWDGVYEEIIASKTVLK